MILEICPFCRNLLVGEEIKSDNQNIWNSPICLGCFKKLDPLPHDDISRFSRKFIDDLPYGVILINNQNIVIRYNKTESELTGLNPNKVEGKDFFQEIAPCTSVDSFRGKLEEMRSNDKVAQTKFDFTFNHMNFFARVSILISYDPFTKNTLISVRKIAEDHEENINYDKD